MQKSKINLFKKVQFQLSKKNLNQYHNKFKLMNIEKPSRSIKYTIATAFQVREKGKHRDLEAESERRSDRNRRRVQRYGATYKK